MAHNTTLSTSARLLCCLGPPSVVITTYNCLSPKTAAISPLTLIPTAWAYKKWRDANNADSSRRAPLEGLVWTYVLTATLGVATVSALQAAVAFGLATLLYGNGEARSFLIQEAMRSTVVDVSPEILTRRAEVASSFRYMALVCSIFFTTAGLGEELLKFLPIIWARRSGTPEERKPRDRAYLDYAISAALSFGVVEGIGFLHTACVTGKETGAKLALSVVERLGLGSTGHVLMAVLTALRAIRKDYYQDRLSWWQVLGPSVFVQ